MCPKWPRKQGKQLGDPENGQNLAKEDLDSDYQIFSPEVRRGGFLMQTVRLRTF